MAKKGKDTILILAFMAFVGFFLVKQSIRIDVGSPSVSFLKLSGNGLQINVKLPILNRSDFDYPIEGFLGQILYGSTALGNVTLAAPVTISARAQAMPEFIAIIDWTALGTQAFDVLKSAGVVDWLLKKIGLGDSAAIIKPVAWQDFSIRGTLYVGGLSVDIDQKLT